MNLKKITAITLSVALILTLNLALLKKTEWTWFWILAAISGITIYFWNKQSQKK